MRNMEIENKLLEIGPQDLYNGQYRGYTFKITPKGLFYYTKKRKQVNKLTESINITEIITLLKTINLYEAANQLNYKYPVHKGIRGRRMFREFLNCIKNKNEILNYKTTA